MQQLKQYFQTPYQGSESFLDEVIFPIFGEDVFENGYNTEVLDDNTELIPMAERIGIHSVKSVGELQLNGGTNIVRIFDITVSDHVQMAHNRVAVQSLVRRIMESYISAFMIFHYENGNGRWDWRFSFCYKGSNKEQTTEPKRFTFLLGPGQSCRTAAENFLKLKELKEDNITLQNIVSAFDVQKLSDDFFNGYKESYEKFVAYITGKRYVKRGNKYVEEHFGEPNEFIYKQFSHDDRAVRDYVKKMLGRIVFLHFLQKKGWLGVKPGEDWGTGDLQFMRHIFQNATDELKTDFLDSVLEPLFDGAFNTDRSADGDLYDVNVEMQEGRVLRFPYLNGGLFDCEADDRFTIRFPAEYFEQLFEFLHRYNFTIDENDPDDAQVGIDPEMLGRIFENLLEDNKDKGAFYTPKEIVQYMCRESLISYLTTNVDNANADIIRKFLSTYEADILGSLAPNVLQRLKDVKICDPAIGSGAFPMGLLRELFFCRSVLQPGVHPSDIKRDIIRTNIFGVDIERGAVDIARLRFWLSLVVDSDTPEVLPNLDYHIMQGNSLLESYKGIDLSKMAIPNLRIVEPQRDLFGNIELGQMQQTFTFFEGDDLNELLDNYFSATDHEEKTALKNSIDKHVRKHIEYNIALRIQQLSLIISAYEGNDRPSKKLEHQYIQSVADNDILNEALNHLAELDSQNSEFFLWHTWFRNIFDKGGFDIVIGNPPYIKEYTARSAFDGFRETSPYYQGKMDLWYGFACQSIDHLTPNGTMCFIATNNWVTNDGASKLRNKVVEDAKINSLIDFNDYMIFEDSASIQTVILLLSKTNHKEQYSFDYRKLSKVSPKKEDAIALLSTHRPIPNFAIVLNPTFDRKQLYNSTFNFSAADSNKILDKISCGKTNFLNENGTNEIFSGIDVLQDYVNKKAAQKLPDKKIGDGIFVLNRFELENLHLSTNEKEIIKPYFTSQQIKRYYALKANDEWIIYAPSNMNDVIGLYPNIKGHLDQYLEVMTSANKPYGLHRTRIQQNFEGDKILSLRKCVERPHFSYVNFDSFVSRAFLVIKTTRFDMKFLTGLFNSKLIEFWLRNRGKMQGNNFQVDKEPLLKIPIKTTVDTETKISAIVNQIIDDKQKAGDADISICEVQIDLLVYHLYCLTYDEVLIVDPDTPITREEYDNFNL